MPEISEVITTLFLKETNICIQSKVKKKIYNSFFCSRDANILCPNYLCFYALIDIFLPRSIGQSLLVQFFGKYITHAGVRCEIAKGW